MSLYAPSLTSEETRRFLLTLNARSHEAVMLRRARARIGDWRPKAHHCFDNVEMWARCNPQHKMVCGFVCFDYRLLFGFIRFTPHAVIENENGELVDITPHNASADYPFIRHIGTLDEFAALVEEQGERWGLDLIL